MSHINSMSTKTDFKDKCEALSGILFWPDKTENIGTYVDVSFAGDWKTLIEKKSCTVDIP